MWSETFDRAADSYDDRPLRFFDLGAEALVRAAELRPGQRVLDVATGTGKVAALVATVVGRSGSVAAIDGSAEMLAHARANLSETGVGLARMDAGRLAIRDRSLDASTCGFGIAFFRPPVAAMREMARVLVPGGRVALSTPAQGAFQPQLDVLFDVLEGAGRPRPEAGRAVSDLDRPEGVDRLLARAGFIDRRILCVEISYHLDPPDGFWAVIRGTAWRSLLRGLAPETVVSIRRELLDRLSARGLSTLSVPTIVATASTPASTADRLRSFRDAMMRPAIAGLAREPGP
ncbi:MAG: class I SAM-dependent methyltransferase [Actinobacteria bacterium]|nr:class I SAM-dependent methyltransferase [Actinomycetota bacterium]